MSSNPNKIISLQELINAQVDAYKLELIMNEAPWVEVTTRLGRKCYSIATIQGIIDQYKFFADQELNNLREAIEIAAAAGAGANGWIDKLVQTWSGRTQEQKNRDVLFVEDFGAIGDGTYHPLSEKYNTLAKAQAKHPFVTSLTQSIDYAATQSALNTGNAVHARIAKYVLTDGLVFKGNRIIGVNTCNWQQMDASAVFRNIDNATVFFMYGTGKKDKTSYYNNAELTTGGVLANPTPYSAGDTEYSLYDFTNADATSTQPATPKSFSAALYVPPGAEGSGIENCVFLPWFDGVNGYLDQNTFNLADDWDVGIFQDACSNFTVDRSAIIGYWRITAHLWSATSSYDRLRAAYGVDNEAISGRAFDTHLNSVRYQGLTGLMIRGGCFYKATDTTATTVTIPWDNSHPFPNSGSRDRIFGSPKGNFAYNSWSKVGNTLVFSGVSPNPITLDLKTNPVRYGFHYGFGGSSVRSSIITGLEHSSRRLASDVDSINLGVSKCLEVHTSNGRNIIFDNTYLQTNGEVMLHVHNFEDLHFVNGSQMEAGSFKAVNGINMTGGARCIATEAQANNPNPTGIGFSGIYLDSSNNITGVVDVRPYIPTGSSSRYSGDTGLFTPRYLLDEQYERPKDATGTNQVVRSLPQKGIRSYAATDWGVGVNGSETLVLQISASGNISFSGQLTNSAGALFLNAKAGSPIYLRSGTVQCAEVSSTGGVLPNITLDNSLGFSGRAWKKAWLERLNISTLPTYTDSTTAKSGGLVNGDVYRTTAGQLMIVY